MGRGHSSGGETRNLPQGQVIAAGLIGPEAQDAWCGAHPRAAHVVELLTPRWSSGPPLECVIEIEQPLQGKLRLELKGWRTDVSGVAAPLWSSRE